MLWLLNLVCFELSPIALARGDLTVDLRLLPGRRLQLAPVSTLADGQIALVRGPLALVGGRLPLVGQPLALIGQGFSPVSDLSPCLLALLMPLQVSLELVGGAFALGNKRLAFADDPFSFGGYALPVHGDPLALPGCRQQSIELISIRHIGRGSRLLARILAGAHWDQILNRSCHSVPARSNRSS